MSASNSFQRLQELSRHFLGTIVGTPIHHLFGRPGGSMDRTPGAGPGTLFVDPDAADTSIRAWRIDGEVVEELNTDPGSLAALHAGGSRLWVDIAGFSDGETIRGLAEAFGIHPVTLADLVNVERHTKVDSDPNQATIIMQVLHLTPDNRQPGLAQLGFLLRDRLLLTFHETPGALFEPVVSRLGRPTSRLRTQPMDYLLCALLDVAVESGFPVIETLADRVDELEDEVISGQARVVLPEVHRQRRALIALGRLFWRQRDLLARLLRDEEVIRQETHIFLRDVHDRTVQLLEMAETTRELAASLMEIHLSISSNRSNQIMQTLTIMAGIFIPLTFIAGVYGMNFEYMPELAWPWAYPAVLGLMLAVSLGLLAWFRSRGWLK